MLNLKKDIENAQKAIQALKEALDKNEEINQKFGNSEKAILLYLLEDSIKNLEEIKGAMKRRA